MYYVQRGRKYGNINQEYNGRRYDSMFEASYAKELDLRMKAGDVKEWRPQEKIELRAGPEKEYDNRRLICRYYVDFWVKLADDSIQLVEVKGFETAVYKLKVKILEATYLQEHPEIEYLVVK